MNIGDKVEVMDPGLIQLMSIMPPGTKPNNVGYIKELWDDGDALIEFPIGDDDMEEHSQVAPYPTTMLKVIK